MSSTVSGSCGGQPSTTQPIATPWLSPKVVTRNMWPKVLKDMSCGPLMLTVCIHANRQRRIALGRRGQTGDAVIPGRCGSIERGIPDFGLISRFRVRLFEVSRNDGADQLYLCSPSSPNTYTAPCW